MYVLSETIETQQINREYVCDDLEDLKNNYKF